MQQIEERDFINALKDGRINPYQIYNFDLDYSSIYSTDYYLNHDKDNILKDQKLNILFFDIECFTNNSGEFPAPNLAKYPIVSNTIYSNFTKTYESYFMLIGENLGLFPINKIKDLERQFKQYLLENEYLEEDEQIKINICQSENEIITNSWQRIHEIDPAVLSGFNSDQFDLPYIYNRLMKLHNDNKEYVHKILSKFGIVNVRNYNRSQIIQIPEYPLADIRHLYVPRSEGGSNYGKTQASYSLDWISSQELNLKKLEYKMSGMSIDDFYIKDPVNYLLYNIIDVVLVNKLNQKLQHIELHNMLRRIMCVPFSASLRGSSVLFDNFVFYTLRKQNKNVRFGIVDEKKISISSEEIKKLPLPKIPLTKKITVNEINDQTFIKYTSKFPGAYVKNAPERSVYDSRDGLIADLDASLPPWEKIFIKRNNKKFRCEIGEYEFQIGDKTLTWDKNNNICWKSILGKTEHDWCYDLIEVITTKNRKVIVTANHSIFVVRNNQTELINAEDLKIGDTVITIDENQEIKSIKKYQYSGKVYDISVEDTERFFAGTGIGVHNTALYPSMIRQHNISFNSFYGKIIDPNCYKFIDLLFQFDGKKEDFPKQFYSSIADYCKKHVRYQQFQNMSEAVQIIYFIIVYLSHKLKNSQFKLKDILKNQNNNIQEYILLKNYFIPLTNMISDIIDHNEYHSFAYDYLLNGEINNDYIYIVENMNETNITVRKILSTDFENYLKSKEVSLSLSGCLFYKHEKETGLFSDFLKMMKARRDEYKKTRNTFKEGSEEYINYDRKQLAVKILMNTTYGLFGLSSYRYSNSELAKAITIQGRLTLKISQIIAEQVLTYLEKN